MSQKLGVPLPSERPLRNAPSLCIHIRSTGCAQVIGGLNTRRSTIVDSKARNDEFTASAEVALNEMFGYSNQLRGSTQGKRGFGMEYKVISLSLSSFSFGLLISFFFSFFLSEPYASTSDVQKKLEDEHLSQAHKYNWQVTTSIFIATTTHKPSIQVCVL